MNTSTFLLSAFMGSIAITATAKESVKADCNVRSHMQFYHHLNTPPKGL